MTTADIVAEYYRLANAGQWDAWCDLFTADTVIDEQLAGHVEGRDRLREMMRGFPDMYASFRNEARRQVVDGDQAAVVSHISASSPAGARIEAEVANYFRMAGGRIAYMANFHDTAPFRPVLER